MLLLPFWPTAIQVILSYPAEMDDSSSWYIGSRICLSVVFYITFSFERVCWGVCQVSFRWLSQTFKTKKCFLIQTGRVRVREKHCSVRMRGCAGCFYVISYHRNSSFYLTRPSLRTFFSSKRTLPTKQTEKVPTPYSTEAVRFAISYLKFVSFFIFVLFFYCYF